MGVKALHGPKSPYQKDRGLHTTPIGLKLEAERL
tara:strand:+ start:249 stop:350 length:102 start_codon:yes stop_codon:yes gene_type:complete